MNCKRCGAVLPSEGYMCKVCGALMDQEQIAAQKENMKANPTTKRPTLFSEQYGVKKEYQPAETSNKGLMAAVMLIIVVFLIAISLIIFLVKR